MTTAEQRAGQVRTAVLGTGIMGSAMARNLAAAGLATTGGDRSPAGRAPLALAAGGVWAQMGTIGLEATADIARRLGELRPGAVFVDAPVSGSKGPAQAGQLLILASGPPAAAAALD